MTFDEGGLICQRCLDLHHIFRSFIFEKLLDGAIPEQRVAAIREALEALEVLGDEGTANEVVTAFVKAILRGYRREGE